MTKKQEEKLRKNLGLSVEEFERIKKEKINLEEIEKERPAFVSTNSPIPPETKKSILTTRDLGPDGKLIEKRFWDAEKTMPKPTLVTGDVALSESEEGDKKRAEVMAEIKSKEEK